MNLQEFNTDILNNLNAGYDDIRNHKKDLFEPGGILEEFAKNSKINSNQLRKFFNELRNLEYKVKSKGELDLVDLYKIIAILAYSKGRKLLNDDDYIFLKKLMEKVNDKEDFELLIEIFETIIAYRKLYQK